MKIEIGKLDTKEKWICCNKKKIESFQRIYAIEYNVHKLLIECSNHGIQEYLQFWCELKNWKLNPFVGIFVKPSKEFLCLKVIALLMDVHIQRFSHRLDWSLLGEQFHSMETNRCNIINLKLKVTKWILQLNFQLIHFEECYFVIGNRW